MPKLAFYPGCSLHSTAREGNQSLLLVLEKLGFSHEEIPDWNCCGGASAVSWDDNLAVELAVRNLVQAKALESDLVVACAHCYRRLLTGKIRTESDAGMKKYLEEELGEPLEGLPEVYNALEVVHSPEVLEKIQLYARKSLSGLKVAAYYGCQLVRTSRSGDFDRPDNSSSLDRIVEALGGEAIPWPYKTECCGGNLSLMREDVSRQLVARILDMARECGAECIVTACPVCQANLDRQQFLLAQEAEKKEGAIDQKKIPVFYFSQLIGLVLGFAPHAMGLNRHFIPTEGALAIAGIH